MMITKEMMEDHGYSVRVGDHEVTGLTEFNTETNEAKMMIIKPFTSTTGKVYGKMELGVVTIPGAKAFQLGCEVD